MKALLLTLAVALTLVGCATVPADPPPQEQDPVVGILNLVLGTAVLFLH